MSTQQSFGGLDKVPVHVEAALHPNSTANFDVIKKRIEKLLEKESSVYKDGPVEFSKDEVLIRELESLAVVDLGDGISNPGKISFWQAELHVHVFQLSEDGPFEDDDGDDEAVSACSQWVLPARDFDGLWGNLIYDSDVKSNLLEYASTAMLFSDMNVDPNVITWNRVVLLHGPPGTGKTSLCKALAHKLAVRLSHRYPNGQLLEINAHSLFSRWFSESGKLVVKLFDHIQELVDDPECLVCVLIDEVESLSASRTASLGSEPSDAVRVVNALLTQIDKLKACKNVIVLTTSNITEAIDVAFVDRADIKQYIGPPSAQARFIILRSCLMELMRVGIITGAEMESMGSFEEGKAEAERASTTAVPGEKAAGSGGPPGTEVMSDDMELVSSPETNMTTTALLYQTAVEAEGLSGRALRKIPFQAHAFFLQSSGVSSYRFCNALLAAVRRENSNRAQISTV